jgi:hypothetical protein
VKQEPRFDVGYMRARDPNLVGRDQYNHYVKEIIQERESFALKVAATKTKARLLFWSGFLMVAGGATVCLLSVLKAAKDGSVGAPQNPFDTGLNIHGYPIAIIAFAIGFVGQFILVAGIILHIVAASRRKTLLNLQPPPPPWRFSDEWH